MRQTGRVQQVQGAVQPVGALVQGVVAGRGARVIPHLQQRRQHLRRHRELRIPGKRALGRCERGLQVADTQIRGRNVRRLPGQHRTKIQAHTGRVISAGLVQQRRVQQHIPGHHDRHTPHTRTNHRTRVPAASRRRRVRRRGRHRRHRRRHAEPDDDDADDDDDTPRRDAPALTDVVVPDGADPDATPSAPVTPEHPDTSSTPPAAHPTSTASHRTNPEEPTRPV